MKFSYRKPSVSLSFCNTFKTIPLYVEREGDGKGWYSMDVQIYIYKVGRDLIFLFLVLQRLFKKRLDIIARDLNLVSISAVAAHTISHRTHEIINNQSRIVIECICSWKPNSSVTPLKVLHPTGVPILNAKDKKSTTLHFPFPGGTTDFWVCGTSCFLHLSLTPSSILRPHLMAAETLCRRSLCCLVVTIECRGELQGRSALLYCWLLTWSNWMAHLCENGECVLKEGMAVTAAEGFEGQMLNRNDWQTQKECTAIVMGLSN